MKAQKELYVFERIFDARADMGVRFQRDKPSKHDFDIELTMDSGKVPQTRRCYPADAIVGMIQEAEALFLNPPPFRVEIRGAQQGRVDRIHIPRAPARPQVPREPSAELRGISSIPVSHNIILFSNQAWLLRFFLERSDPGIINVEHRFHLVRHVHLKKARFLFVNEFRSREPK